MIVLEKSVDVSNASRSNAPLPRLYSEIPGRWRINVMTQRIKISAQLYTTNVFYGHIPDEITGQELVTRNRIEKATFQWCRVISSLMGNSKIDIPIDSSPRTIPVEKYELYDSLQPGLEHSTENKPCTFIFRVVINEFTSVIDRHIALIGS